MRWFWIRRGPVMATMDRRGARAPRRIVALIAIALPGLGAARRADAQVDVPLGVRHAASPDGQAIRAVGDVVLCRAFDCERAISTALELAPSSQWRIMAEAAAGRSVIQPASALSTDARIDLSYGDAERRVWIGRGGGTARGSDSSASGLNRWVEYGAALRWRSVSVAVDVGTGAQPSVAERAPIYEPHIIQSYDTLSGVTRVDTVLQRSSASSAADRIRWTSTALRLGWRSDQWKLGAVVGRATTDAGRPVVWSTAEAERRIARSAGVVVSLGTYPGSVGAIAVSAPRARWMLGLGLIAATGRRSHDAPTPAAAPKTSESFGAIRLPTGRYRLEALLANAARVELASDLTGWRPVAMQRTSDGRWSVELPATSGVHRVSLRVDGGPWTAPPGAVAEDDGFGGSAAVLMIP